MLRLPFFSVVALLHAHPFSPVVAFSEAYAQFDSSKVAKAAAKLDSFAKQPRKKILLVDGSNLRGVSRLGWDHVELQSRIEAYCKFQAIDFSILVWDHGNSPFAIPTSDRLVCLFSGLSQRADDVLVKEVENLLLQEPRICLAVITNDVGLTARIRKKVDMLSGEPPEASSKDHVTVDSSRFAEILSYQVSRFSLEEQIIRRQLQDIRDQINIFRAGLRHGLASRSEKTWERVVLAEILLRQLFEIYGSCKADNFIEWYVQDLRARGFRTTTDGSPASSIIFKGPSRLDKRQRRALERFQTKVSLLIEK